jgi:site-specific recombinase XerD
MKFPHILPSLLDLGYLAFEVRRVLAQLPQQARVQSRRSQAFDDPGKLLAFTGTVLLGFRQRGLGRAGAGIVRVVGEKAKLGRVWPHMLRHGCGYYLADQGTDLRTMQDYLGHHDPKRARPLHSGCRASLLRLVEVA